MTTTPTAFVNFDEENPPSTEVSTSASHQDQLLHHTPRHRLFVSLLQLRSTQLYSIANVLLLVGVWAIVFAMSSNAINFGGDWGTSDFKTNPTSPVYIAAYIWTWSGLSSGALLALGGRLATLFTHNFTIDFLLWFCSAVLWVAAMFVSSRSLWLVLVPVVSLRVCVRFMLYETEATVTELYSAQFSIPVAEVQQVVTAVAAAQKDSFLEHQAMVQMSDLGLTKGELGHVGFVRLLRGLADIVPRRQMQLFASSLKAAAAGDSPNITPPQYDVSDVMVSTCQHISAEIKILPFLLLALCATSFAQPLISVIVGRMLTVATEAYQQSQNGASNDHQMTQLTWYSLSLGGVLLLYVSSSIAVSFLGSKVIANATSRLQQRLVTQAAYSTISLRDDKGDEFTTSFTGNVGRINALWNVFLWSAVTPAFNIMISLLVACTKGVPGIRMATLYLAFGIPVSSFKFLRTMTAADSKVLVPRLTTFYNKFEGMIPILPSVSACDAGGFVSQTLSPVCEAVTVAWKQLLFHSNLVQNWYACTSLTFVVAVNINLLLYSMAKGGLSSGDFFALAGIAQFLTVPMTQLGVLSRQILQNAGALRQVDLVLADDRLEGLEKEDAHDLPPLSDELRIQKAWFQYPGSHYRVLDEVDLTIKAGEYVVIAGGSGSGKSTLLSVLMQQRTLQAYGGGTFEVDGMDVECCSRSSFKKQAAVVFQNSMIFWGTTVRDNICFGSDVLDSEVEEVARSAQIHDVIQALPLGYDTVLEATGGQCLSGGQLQRICIARALYRKPTMLFLDEATSALDPVTEGQIIDTLMKLHERDKKLTIISVSHHPETAKPADQVVVLDSGKISEIGTYNDLVSKNGHFAALVAAANQA